MKNFNQYRFTFLLALICGVANLNTLHAQDNVGIGVTAPNSSARLHLGGTDKGFLMPVLNSSQEAAIASPANGLLIYSTEQNKYRYRKGGAWETLNPWNVLNNGNMYYDSGNIGINSFYSDVTFNIRNAPDNFYALNVENSEGENIFNVTDTGNVGLGTNPTIDLAIGDSDTGLQQQGDGQLAVYTNNVERARFNSIGNLGIGTTSPNSKLSISPSTAEAKITLWDGGNTTNHYGLGISSSQLNYHVAGTSARHVFYAGGKNGDGTELMRIEGDGNVRMGPASNNFSNVILQVGNTGPSQRAAHFENDSGVVNGGFKSTVSIENTASSGAAALWLDNGFAAMPGGGDWANSSDRRLKQDIKKYKEGLEEIRKVNAVTYRYNEKSGHNTDITYVGVIAQELQEIAPHMVNDEAEYLIVNSSAFTYMLINAVQEQDETIQSQAQTIQDQQAEMEAMKARLDKIEEMLKK